MGFNSWWRFSSWRSWISVGSRITMNDPGPIPPFLDRTRLIHSYSGLSCYENVCPHQYYHTYILKTVPYVETPERKRGNDAHAALDKRISAGVPLPPDMAQWEPFAMSFDGLGAKAELKLAITASGTTVDYWSKQDAWLRGRVDVAVVNGTSAYILDWKTGNSKYEDKLEIGVYAMLLHAANPQLTSIKGTYAWLKDNRLGQSYDLSDTRTTWNKVNAIVKNIERDRARGEFEKREGPLCGWCDVRSCEHRKERK